MAGKPRYTTEQVIAALRETKGMSTIAAKKLGCDPDTVRAYVKRHSTVADAQREEREGMTDVAELSLYRAVQNGDAWAVCFYLKTQGKGRGYVERQEVTGAEGKPIQMIEVVGDDEGEEDT